MENEWLLVAFQWWLVWICLALASSFWVVLCLFVLENCRTSSFLPLEVLICCWQVTSHIFFDVLSRLPSLNIFTNISEINFYLPLNGLRLFCVMLVPNIIYHATIFVFITHFFYNFLLTHMLNSIIHKFNFLGILLIFIFDLWLFLTSFGKYLLLF